MTTITVLAPAKVNLCLFLGPARRDGRHELVTLFESVSLADELAISESGRDEVVCSGVEGPNLVLSAIERLRACGWDGPAIRVEIDKRIPVAGGMGGGSADAGALLRAARELAPLDRAAMAEVASELGADVPSQLAPGLSLGTGAGEIVEPLAPLPPHALAVVPLAHSLRTADVYREADRLRRPRPVAILERWRAELGTALRSGEPLPEYLMTNDLAAAALSLCPEIGVALEAVERQAADQALVSGSGPTVFGLFWGSSAAAAKRRAAEAAAALQSSYPAALAAAPVSADYGNPRNA